MSIDPENLKQLNNLHEGEFGMDCKPWDYSPTNMSQNRTCSTPVDELEEMYEDEDYYNTNSVEVQTEKSSLFLLKEEKKISITKTNIQNPNTKGVFGNMKQITLDNTKSKELDSEKLRREKQYFVKETSVVDTETELDQPMDYTLCYNETNLEEDKGESSLFAKNEFSNADEMLDEEKSDEARSKMSKESSKSRKEIFSNPSKSFREIFNFFKDRDKKKSTVEITKVPPRERIKVPKICGNYEIKPEIPQPNQLMVDSSDKQSKSKFENLCSQDTPLMFSRCSSLGSLSGLEQSSIQDDRSSIISDVSLRTSGITSPTELSVSPAPSSSKSQFRTQIGSFGRRKIQYLQEKLRMYQNSGQINDNSPSQSEGNLKKFPSTKRSVFEDNLTLFKDESTPTKIHSIAASSLSSLTIDDDYEDELMQKLVLNKEKSNDPEKNNFMKDITDRREPIGESNHQTDSSCKSELNETAQTENDNSADEESDKITDLNPYEEQILDRCIRTGIAKWKKKKIDDIEPFSWDVGLTCRSTRTILTSKIRRNSDIDIQNNIFRDRKDYKQKVNLNNNENLLNCESTIKYYNDNEVYNDNGNTNSVNDSKSDDNSIDENYETNLNVAPLLIEEEEYLEEINDDNCNSGSLSYEEHLLDQCIRRGIAKVTKRNIDDIKPFSWDVDQICLTTRAMKLYNRNDGMHKNL